LDLSGEFLFTRLKNFFALAKKQFASGGFEEGVHLPIKAKHRGSRNVETFPKIMVDSLFQRYDYACARRYSRQISSMSLF
jgi:hypothetical protein